MNYPISLKFWLPNRFELLILINPKCLSRFSKFKNDFKGLKIFRGFNSLGDPLATALFHWQLVVSLPL